MQVKQSPYLARIHWGAASKLTRSVIRSVWLLILLGHLSSASADTILYQTGFEPPRYGLGGLLGQDNWGNTTSVPFVQSSNTFSGTQAVQFNANGLSAQTIIGRPIAYSSVGNSESVVKFTMRAKLTNSVSTSNWNIFSVSSDAGFLVQLLVVQNRNARIASAGASTGNVLIASDVWNHYEMNIDFSAQMASAFVNGQLIGQRPLHFSPATNVNRVAFGVNSLPGSDTIFYDDLLVMSIPEPRSIVLLMCGAIPIILRRGPLVSRHKLG
jgi:hypothetical protein